MKVTNTQVGPRGLNTEDGPVLVEPGATVDVKLCAAEKKVAEGTGWFAFGTPEVGEMDDDALRAYLAENSVEADGRWGREKLLAEAKKVNP